MTRTVDPILVELRSLILRMATLAEAILDQALRAVAERAPALAREVRGQDIEIDRLDVEVDEVVLRALALQAPVAEELRQVVAIKTMATDLERVGDLARNVAASALRLAERPRLDLPVRLGELGELAQRQLRMALDSFTEQDSDGARRVIAHDDAVDELQDQIVRDAIQAIEAEPSSAAQCVDVILIAESLERVGDHATNIAEDVILIAEAENVKHASKLRQRA